MNGLNRIVSDKRICICNLHKNRIFFHQHHHRHVLMSIRPRQHSVDCMRAVCASNQSWAGWRAVALRIRIRKHFIILSPIRTWYGSPISFDTTACVLAALMSVRLWKICKHYFESISIRRIMEKYPLTHSKNAAWMLSACTTKSDSQSHFRTT